MAGAYPRLERKPRRQAERVSGGGEPAGGLRQRAVDGRMVRSPAPTGVAAIAQPTNGWCDGGDVEDDAPVDQHPHAGTARPHAVTAMKIAGRSACRSGSSRPCEEGPEHEQDDVTRKKSTHGVVSGRLKACGDLGSTVER